MTQDEIMKLEAGRELDAMIAEHVMGLVPCTSIFHSSGEDLPCHALPESPDRGSETKWYSTDIAAAWQVVEWFMERGDIFLEYWSDSEWFVSDKPDVVRRDVGAIIARCDGQSTGKPSLPLAICRAALLAVMDNRP